MNMEPLHFLTFPVILGSSVPGGSSPCSRQNCTTGGKSVGSLWKGKLSPGRREGESEHRSTHLHPSPWLVAPLHLPLVGQNCWPHMASGFSASIWLRLREQKEADRDKGWFHFNLQIQFSYPKHGRNSTFSLLLFFPFR